MLAIVVNQAKTSANSSAILPVPDLRAFLIMANVSSASIVVEVAVAAVRANSSQPRYRVPGRTVNTNEPVLPERDNYLPQSTDEVDGFIWQIAIANIAV